MLILGIPRADALALGRRFGQLATVFGERHGKAELLACEPPIQRLDPVNLAPIR